MPRRVDHALRRRQIADAVCRITAKGGLASATFREVAAEAGVSVRLVQYYFGSKDQLLLSTLHHVAERTTRRIAESVAAADTPHEALRAMLGAFIPTDDESRETMLVFIALHTASLVDPTLAREEARAVPRAFHAAIAGRLRHACLPPGADPEKEAAILAGLVPSLVQAVLGGLQTADGALDILDYAIGRAIGRETHERRADPRAGPSSLPG